VNCHKKQMSHLSSMHGANAMLTAMNRLLHELPWGFQTACCKLAILLAIDLVMNVPVVLSCCLRF